MHYNNRSKAEQSTDKNYQVEILFIFDNRDKHYYKD